MDESEPVEQKTRHKPKESQAKIGGRKNTTLKTPAPVQKRKRLHEGSETVFYKKSEDRTEFCLPSPFFFFFFFLQELDNGDEHPSDSTFYESENDQATTPEKGKKVKSFDLRDRCSVNPHVL